MLGVGLVPTGVHIAETDSIRFSKSKQTRALHGALPANLGALLSIHWVNGPNQTRSIALDKVLFVFCYIKYTLNYDFLNYLI